MLPLEVILPRYNVISLAGVMFLGWTYGELGMIEKARVVSNTHLAHGSFQRQPLFCLCLTFSGFLWGKGGLASFETFSFFN